ncbi:MAG: GNAT family N-acetyltransferase [Acidobacteriota bacterium]
MPLVAALLLVNSATALYRAMILDREARRSVETSRAVVGKTVRCVDGPMSEIRIRRAQSDDAESLAHLSGELGYPAAAAAVAQRLAVLLDRGDHAVLVAESAEGRVLGWAHAFVAHRLESPSFAEIGGLVVSEGVRGQGIGRCLVAAAERWARNRGLGAIRVRSNVVREEAHAFYRRLGYENLKEQAVFRKSLDADTNLAREVP